MLDINGIRSINFPLGYDIEEKLIKKALKRLRIIFKDDRYICRYSEDVFAIIDSSKSTDKEYKALASEIIGLFKEPFNVESYEFGIEVNIGMCTFPNFDEDELPLKSKAKIALNRSKKAGKNNYKFYSEELNIRYYKDFVLRSDIWHSIDNEELELYYQPVVNMVSNEIVGVEALIRWNHPQWGLVSPVEFISIAEETGQIVDIGKWVVDRACKDYKRWFRENAEDILVGINLSGVQFLEEGFSQKILDIIEKHNLRPEFFIMELTESILLNDLEKVRRDIKTFNEAGMLVALDDYGTGYSSLFYLNSLNIDILKLDREFIREVPLDKTSTIITKSTVELAKELGMKVIAEGLETWEHLSYLKSLSCKLGQGYLYSRPLPVEEIEILLGKEKCEPSVPNSYKGKPEKDRRKYFRIDLYNLLESDLTILELGGEDVDVGNTKVLIKNIGPGGLCFISNIKFPVQNDIILKFKTELVKKEIILYGNPVWTRVVSDREEKIHEYGIQFRITESEREDLIKTLNKVQIKMRKDPLFAEGDFVSVSYTNYFKNEIEA